MSRVFQVETIVRVVMEEYEDIVVFANIESDTDLEKATGDAVLELTNYSYYDHEEN